MDRAVLPKRDHSKLKFPHIEGNEIELPKGEPKQEEPVKQSGPRGQEKRLILMKILILYLKSGNIFPETQK